MIFSHPICAEHFPGPGHPEAPARLAAVLEALAADEFGAVPRREAPPATREQLERAHAAQMVELLFRHAPSEGLLRIDADTVMSPSSLNAALHAAGAVCTAIDEVAIAASALAPKQKRRAFCAVRPPGHHATHGQAMGFCLFNSIAVGAHHALAVHGLARVAIVDFDVHHGNGSQDIFWADPRVLYASSHQSPLYPGSGRVDERGAGNIVNVPLAPGSGSREFRDALARDLLPAVDAFRPELVLISAGFDAHRLDPLANLDLAADDYGWITAELAAIADRHAAGRVVSSLEGGYSLTALRESSAAHCRALFAA